MLRWFPENISTYGGDLDSLFVLIYYIVGFWFILTEGVLFYFIFRYRKRAGHKADPIRGEKWSELAWVFVPAVIVLALDLSIDAKSGPAWARVKEHLPVADVEVHVMARQFAWEFTYPGPDKAFGTPDDVTISDELHVPVDKNVVVTLESKDVIHSFFVPNVRLKQDILPGRKIKQWFNVTKPGEYEIGCAQLCGFGHYTMRAILKVHTGEDYQKWVQERWPAPAAG